MLRKTLFWIHLTSGLLAGLVIAVMSVTGAALAFEDEWIALAEGNSRQIQPPAVALARLSLEDLADRVSAASDRPISSVTVSRDPATAVAFAAAPDELYWANPYTGEVRSNPGNRLRGLFRSLLSLHRWLGADGEGRAVGRAVTGACTVAFALLVATGLVLWWPPTWKWRRLRLRIVPSVVLRGRAREWNWHMALGFWFSPVLLVLSLTGIVLAYRWAADLPYRLTHTAPSRRPVERSETNVETPASLDRLAAAATARFPDWTELSLRWARPSESRPDVPPRTRDERTALSRTRLSVVSASVRAAGDQPSFLAHQLRLDAGTARIVGEESYATMNDGRRIHSWIRHLHTGEAFGMIGKLVAAAACLCGALLVWTGIVLAARRLFG
ncbi:PepSY domain-containing protein [Opitutaceae bacterium EW11]|nr:PepSY domain-containing protein [Opitutaceae bacterium EW11]